jgi:hypothetical protein
MSTNQEYPLLNGVAPSWADIIGTITVSGQPLFKTIDIKAIHTARTREVGQQRGALGGRKRRRTKGSVDYEASITFYRSGYQDFLRLMKNAAQAAGYVRGNQAVIGEVVFGFNLMWTPTGDVQIYERRVKGCVVMGDTIDDTEGTDAGTIEVPLDVQEIADMIDSVEVVLL